MRCYICDREDELIVYDTDKHSFTPCVVCQEAIEEALDDYESINTESTQGERTRPPAFPRRPSPASEV
jgi:hypothetical protein